MTTTSPRLPEDGASAPPQRPGKAKRTFTPANILKTVANCAISFPDYYPVDIQAENFQGASRKDHARSNRDQ